MKIITKGILSIIGAALIHILIGSYHTWGRLISYYLSYLHYHNNPSITLAESTLFTPFVRLIYTSSLALGVVASSKLGLYIPCFISILFLILSHSILSLSTNINLIIMSFAMFGIGIGLPYMSVILNAWCYFPKRKGLIIGIILTSFGSSGFILKLIADEVINPNGLSVNKETGYYDEVIANNILSYLKLLIGIIVLIGITSLIMIKPFNSAEAKEEASEEYEELVESNEFMNASTMSYFGGNENIKIGFKSKPFYQLLFMFLLSNLFNALHISNKITFGEKVYYNHSFITNNIIIWNIANGCFRMFWGIMLDRFKFKDIYLFSIFMQILTFSTFYFISKIKTLFFLYNLFIALFNSCSVVVIPYSFYKIFGIKNGGIYFGISQFISAIGSFGIPFLIDYLNGPSIHYLILFLGNSVTKMLACIILCFIEEKRFDYGNKDKKIKLRLSSSINSSNSNI